jgi:Immunoglobulin domain
VRKNNKLMRTITFAACLLCISSATAQNLISNGDFTAGNLSGWTSTAVAPTTITYEGTAGNPSGAALLARNNSAATANGNYLYQIIPVVNGAQYKLSAQWKGDLLNGGTGRNWAEVYINFTATNTAFVAGTIRYKKATDGGPNDTPMPWDWQDITASPDSSNPGPTNGVFTATGDYMTIAFNLGGRAQTSNNTQPGYYWVDNVSVTPWPPTSAPVITNATLAGSAMVLRGTNGPANGAYSMLCATNLSEPTSNWESVGVRSFDGNGNFSFTNPVVGDPAAFYRLRVVSSVPVFPPLITAQPQSLGLQVGQNANFDVTATGSAPLTYRWYFNTNTLLASGASSSLALRNVQVSDSGKISVTVSNLLGTDESTFATLTVTNSTQPPAITVQPANLTVTVGQTANFSVSATGAMPLSYQWYYNTNTVLTDETNSTLSLFNVATNQAGKYSVTVTNLYGTTNSVFATLNVSQEVLAFPTAEGYGKYVTGGRGGAVYEVTTLNPTGTGSLGAAIGASGPRTVVFRVAGTITGNFNITKNDITIAGQTAPGDGICIKGNLSTSADNIIIRYIRVRYDPTTLIAGDALGGRYRKNIIFDHVSTSWSADEVLTLYFNENTTVQWCIISEGCEKFEGGVSVGHRFGGIWGNNYGTWHHNLIVHNDSRNPRWASGCGYNDYRNNVIYNWGYESCYGGEKEQPGDTNHTFSTINMIANYYKPGPATTAFRIANPSARSSTDKGDWYVAGNYFNGRSDITTNNWIGVTGGNYNQLSVPWAAMPINQQTPQDAYLSVLDQVGCSFPNRDQVDADIIDDVRNGTAQYGNNGIISVPADVGGWPTLASGTPPIDSDHDGMPDAWETSHGLNPNNAADRNTVGANGYTMLENYLNELAP